MSKKSAIVVFSGGQDSTVCLGIACKTYKPANVLAVSFAYGQKHSIELEVAKEIAARMGVEHIVVDVDALRHMRSSALVNGGDVSTGHEYLSDLPASFVPVRNALFLTIAYGLAMEHGADMVITGVCQTDYSGYPDCREEFIVQLQHALMTGYQSSVVIRTPLMNKTKAQTWRLAEEFDILDETINSHTCYNSDREHLHPWGYGCNECPACELRRKGWEEYKSKYAATEV